MLFLFVTPTVSHASWWEYLNDKTVISFIKSIFLKTQFIASKYKPSWGDSGSSGDVKSEAPSFNTAGNDAPSSQSTQSVSVTPSSAPSSPVQATTVTTVDEPPLNISGMQYSKSDNALVSVDSSGAINLKVTENKRSAWISLVVNTTKLSNYVYLDLDFTSEVASQGVFTTFFDQKDLGYMDERFFGANARRIVVGYAPQPAGMHIVTFRLDQFGSLPSSVTLRGIGVGFFTE